MQKIIIDTDIGDDIDDALAITFALNSPEVDVVGITTVYRDTVKRAKIAKKLLKLARREDIPVRYGIGQPIKAEPFGDSTPCQYSEDVKDIPVEGGALDFLEKMIMENPGEITIVAIGALTNIGLLFRTKPHVIEKLKELVIMGGCFFENQNEWNIRCDPDAAKICFESGVKLTAVGLDVTMKCYLPKDKIEVIHNTDKPVAQYLSKLIKLWNGRVMVLHDPLAVAAVFKPDLLEIENHDISVETEGQFTKGFTLNNSYHLSLFNPDTPVDSNVYVCRSVKNEEFENLFFERIIQK